MYDLITFTNTIISNANEDLEVCISNYYDDLKSLFYMISDFKDYEIKDTEVDGDCLMVRISLPSWKILREALEQISKESNEMSFRDDLNGGEFTLVCLINKKEG